ncbi:MAG: SUMF1/EgtB/PvdO family nonheme iron enzyme [Cyanobium sp.]
MSGTELQLPITLDMVPVGNPGNLGDPRTGFGRVNYEYNISKYEITIQQYTIFLNAVAASDPHGLYNPSMATDKTIAGIARSGSPGSYTYSVISPSGTEVQGASSPGNRPIAYIDWFDAARFANWMHNGQGNANTETGAYSLWAAKNGSTMPANPNARYKIPTQDEWYKAAYYSPLLNQGKGGYYVFPSQSDATPGSIPGNVVINRSNPNQANYYNGAFSVTQQALLSPLNNQNYLTNVGAFANSSSYYGTFDQGGNIYEWIDTPGNRQQGRLRGGFWMSNRADLSYLDYYNTSPSYSFNGSGFRLASPRWQGSGSLQPNSQNELIQQPENPVNYSVNNKVALIEGMPMVVIGNPGNKEDARTGSGSVDYVYNIGKYEVTIQQYTDFLNAVASSDPYQLYNPSMATDLNIAGIARSGSPGSYRYRIIGPAGTNPNGARSPGNRPIAYVNWFDAARFANWMHNGRGAGDTETGAYTLNGVTTGVAVPANPGARFHIPTPNEWYKAAFYSPSLNGGEGGYYVFPTQHDATPGSVPGNNIKYRNTPNQINYFNAGFAVTQLITPSASQNYLTDVGAFSKSASYYGTFDQGGNVYEWNDDQESASQRSLRGGYFVSNVADTSYLDAYFLPPEYESSGSGFRLVSRQQAEVWIDHDDTTTSPSYAFSPSSEIVYEGGVLVVGVSSSNVAAGTSLYWLFSGTGITPADFSDNTLSGSCAIGGDGRASFSRRLVTDGQLDPDETAQLTFYLDAAHTVAIGSPLTITFKEPRVGVVTDGNDVITGTAAAEFITGVPSDSITRGRGSVDKLSGAGGNDLFVLGDRLGHFYNDGMTNTSGTTDLAWITDFSAGDRIQLHGNASLFQLVSARYSGFRGVQINALLPSSVSGGEVEAIAFLQGATVSGLNLTNSNQFSYIN